MMTDDEIYSFGMMLEGKGLSHSEIDTVLEHQGVKGMKWGVRRAEKRAEKGPERFGNRNNKSTQRKVDRVKRVAEGTATLGDKARVLNKTYLTELVKNDFSLKDVASAKLERSQQIQTKIKSGKKNVSDILMRLEGVDYRELDFSYNG